MATKTKLKLVPAIVPMAKSMTAKQTAVTVAPTNKITLKDGPTTPKTAIEKQMTYATHSRT